MAVFQRQLAGGGLQLHAMALHAERERLYVVTPACVLVLCTSTLTQQNEFPHGIPDANIRGAQVHGSQLFVGQFGDKWREGNNVGVIEVLSLEGGREGERLRTIDVSGHVLCFTILQDHIYISKARPGDPHDRNIFVLTMTGELVSSQEIRSASGQYFDITSRGDELIVADVGRGAGRVYTLQHCWVDGGLTPHEERYEEEDAEEEESDESDSDSEES